MSAKADNAELGVDGGKRMANPVGVQLHEVVIIRKSWFNPAGVVYYCYHPTPGSGQLPSATAPDRGLFIVSPRWGAIRSRQR
jgi:hypothetical protein